MTSAAATNQVKPIKVHHPSKLIIIPSTLRIFGKSLNCRRPHWIAALASSQTASKQQSKPSRLVHTQTHIQSLTFPSYVTTQVPDFLAVPPCTEPSPSPAPFHSFIGGRCRPSPISYISYGSFAVSLARLLHHVSLCRREALPESCASFKILFYFFGLARLRREPPECAHRWEKAISRHGPRLTAAQGLCHGG